MTQHPRQRTSASSLSRLVSCLSLCSGLFLLHACSQLPSSEGSPAFASARSSSGDVMTASDEPEARRRARLRLSLAIGYFEQGKTTIALDEVKKVIAIDPTFAEAYDLRGLVYMQLNNPKFADDSFREAIALKPRDANVHHNYGWFLCQQGRYGEAKVQFDVAMANPLYPDRSKTLLTRGICEAREGKIAEAELSLLRSYELDAGNPVTGYNLALLLYRRGEYVKAQFYIRRINNSELANAETFWLGVKVERRLNNEEAVLQLGTQMKRRFPNSREAIDYDRGAFDE